MPGRGGEGGGGGGRGGSLSTRTKARLGVSTSFPPRGGPEKNVRQLNWC